mgnify:CR=1 FL=1
MLVGLAAKNAILIVEFAKEQVDRGIDVVQAALHASQLRFRPILMTSLAFILGMLPMVIASGPGSASRQAIGTGVFFGMIFAVTVGIFVSTFLLCTDIQDESENETKIGYKKTKEMMKHTLLYIAVSGMTLLTSCQLGKHYTRPDLHLPQH